jgi:nitrogen fixation/metabolism regulation signal transduction histidine kinase
MIVIDVTGRISYSNRAAGRLFPCHAVQPGIAIPLQAELSPIAPVVTEAMANQRRVESEVHMPVSTGTTTEEHIYRAVAAPISEARDSGLWLMVEDVTKP